MGTFHDAFDGSHVPELLVVGLVVLGVALVGVTGEFVGLEFTLVVYGLLWVVTLFFLADPETFAAGPRGWWTGESASETDAEESDDPLRVLRRRYARGDIDETEFERRLDRLLASESRGETVESADAEQDGHGDSNARQEVRA